MVFIRLEDFVNARVQALRCVMSPDIDYFWRKVCRWACVRLNISIFEAQRMPITELLRHFYEVQYEDTEEEEREELLGLFLETPDKAATRKDDEEADKESVDEFEAMVRAEAKQAALEAGYKVLSKEEAKKMRERLKDGPPVLPTRLGDAPTPRENVPAPLPATPPVSLADLPEDVSICFADPDEPDPST